MGDLLEGFPTWSLLPCVLCDNQTCQIQISSGICSPTMRKDFPGTELQYSEDWSLFPVQLGKKNMKLLEWSATKPIIIILASSAVLSRSINGIMLSVILALINGNVIRNGSIRVDPAWATTALLLIGVVEVTVVKTEANARFSTWLRLSLFKEESSLSKSLLEAV